ncbi:MAG: hypothetical protein OEV08_12410, partial [Nitrospira sp.]|nr:hypothetical protein [Nitrospira sp.]
LGPTPPKDNFDLNNASGIAILKAGTLSGLILPNGQVYTQTKDYAFVTGYNRFIQGTLSHDPYLEATLTPEELASLRYDLRQPVGGNVGVIEDPFGVFGAPKLIAATKPTMESFPDNLDLSLDGTTLYAAYRSNHAIQIFDVEEILKTIEAYRHVTVSTTTGQGVQPILSVTPLDDLKLGTNAVSFVPAGFIVTGGLPQGVRMDAEIAKVQLGFGFEPGGSVLLTAPVAGDPTPMFRWLATQENGQPIPENWTTKLYVSTFSDGKGLFPDDVIKVIDGKKVDLHQNRILNGVEGVHVETAAAGVYEFTMSASRSLTLGQTYYMGVQIFNEYGVRKGEGFKEFKLAQKPAPNPATATNFSSVTVLTHGFQPEVPNGTQSLLTHGQWLWDMADQIVTAGGGNEAIKISNVLRYDKVTGNWLTRLNTLANPVAGRPVVLLPDWWTESDISDSGFSEAAADSFFASLVTLDRTLKANPTDAIGKIFHSSLHFIGHSRGTVVTSELLQRLGEYETRVLSHQTGYRPLDIQLTTLDVHDEFGGFDANGNVINTTGQTNLTPLGINWTDFNEPSVLVWSNVDFAENYYQTLGNGTKSATPNGREVVGADLNVKLNGLAGFLRDDADLEFQSSAGIKRGFQGPHSLIGPHSRVWRWYAGTTDLTTPTFERTIAGNEPIFRSLTDVPKFNPASGEPIGGGGSLPWYVPLADYANYYGQPSLTVGVVNASWEGLGLGWWYSELGGGKSSRPLTGTRELLRTDNTAIGETPITPELTVWSGSAIPTLFNGDFEAGNMQRGSLNLIKKEYRGTSTPGWAFHQNPTIGENNGFVTRDAKIESYTLSNGSVGHAAELNSEGVTQLVHNRFYIPTEAQFVQFKYFAKEGEFGRDNSGQIILRQPDVKVYVRVGTEEYRIGTLTPPQPANPGGPVQFQATALMSLTNAVNVMTGATKDLRGEVGELIFRLS